MWIATRLGWDGGPFTLSNMQGIGRKTSNFESWAWCEMNILFPRRGQGWMYLTKTPIWSFIGNIADMRYVWEWNGSTQFQIVNQVFFLVWSPDTIGYWWTIPECRLFVFHQRSTNRREFYGRWIRTWVLDVGGGGDLVCRLIGFGLSWRVLFCGLIVNWFVPFW